MRQTGETSVCKIRNDLLCCFKMLCAAAVVDRVPFSYTDIKLDQNTDAAVRDGNHFDITSCSTLKVAKLDCQSTVHQGRNLLSMSYMVVIVLLSNYKMYFN